MNGYTWTALGLALVDCVLAWWYVERCVWNQGGADMAVGFRPQVLEDIRAKIDLVDFVSAHPPSEPGGLVAIKLEQYEEMKWRGRCPFHDDVPPAIPALIVHQKHKVFHCFTCGAGGDVFGYVMRRYGLSFSEAVRVLAQMAGVSLPGSADG